MNSQRVSSTLPPPPPFQAPPPPRPAYQQQPATGYPHPPYPVYSVPTSPQPETYKPTKTDTAFALALLVAGFFCWEWHVPFAGVGATLFYGACLGLGYAYLRTQGVRQNLHSVIWLVLAGAGALRFTLLDADELSFLRHLLVVTCCLLWIAQSARNTCEERISGYLLGDITNQYFVTPLLNLGRWFTALGSMVKSKAEFRKVAIAAFSLVLCLPVFALVLFLLSEADDSFADSMAWLLNNANVWDHLVMYLVDLIFAIPLAAYIFGTLVGNAKGYHAKTITKDGSQKLLHRSKVLPASAVYAPLAVFTLLYLAFFTIMGSYLFSAFSGVLPGGFSYADYARRGFFELCGVAFINLCAISGARLFTKGGDATQKALRFFTVVLSVFTLLLIITAVSKLLLYINSYGLSQLRLQALAFLVVLFAVFSVIAWWQLKPQAPQASIGRPLAWISLLAAVGFMVVDADALIANYNVDRYLSGAQSTIDTEMLGWMNDGVVPALERLEANATDPTVRENAREAIDDHILYGSGFSMWDEVPPANQFPDWNLQSALARSAES
jgi:hypothetical protein